MDLRTNAINEVMFGFFMDNSDGKTEMNALTIANTDIRLHKYQASAFAAKHSGGGSYISNATYLFRFDSTDVDTPGPLKVQCIMTSCLPVKMEFNVLTEAEWQNKYGTARNATASMLTSVQTNVDSVLGTLNSVKAMTSNTYTYGTLTSQLTSVQNKADSVAVVLGSLYGSVTIMSNLSAADIWAVATRSLTDSIARISQLTSVQLALDTMHTSVAIQSTLLSVQAAVDAGGATITPSDVWGYSVKALTDSVARSSQLTSVQAVIDSTYQGVNSALVSLAALNNLTADSVWAVTTRALTDSVARASQLTSVQLVADSALGTINSVKAMTSNTYTYGALTSQLTSVQSALASAPADTWAVTTRSLTDSVARASQLTSVQLALDTVRNSVAMQSALLSTQLAVDAINITPSDVWGYSVKVLTDSLARISQLTSVQLTVDAFTGGGDATLSAQSVIIAHLEGIKGPTWAIATDSLEAIRDRGDAAWITGSGLAGANTVTLTIQDDSGNNIPEAAVEVYDSAGTTFYERKQSNSSGQTIFKMDDGTYTIVVHKAGYSWSNTALVVAGDMSQTITGTANVLPAPVTPDMCRISMYVKYLDGTIPTSLTTALSIIELPHIGSNTAYSGVAFEGIYNSSTGLLYWDILQGAMAVITVEELGIDRVKITIPSTATAEIEDLL